MVEQAQRPVRTRPGAVTVAGIVVAVELLGEIVGVVLALSGGYPAVTFALGGSFAVIALIRAALLVGFLLGRERARRALALIMAIVAAVLVFVAFLSLIGVRATGSGLSRLIVVVVLFSLALAGRMVLAGRTVRAWSRGEREGQYPVGRLVGWARERGWVFVHAVPKRVLRELRGVPFDDYWRRRIPFLMTGQTGGLPAWLLQLEFHKVELRRGHSVHSPSSGQVSSLGGYSVEAASAPAVLVVELPHPVPELVVQARRNVLDDVSDLMMLNRATGFFQRGDTHLGSAAPRVYHVSGASPDYVRAIATPERLSWLYNDGRGPAPNVVLGPVWFRLAGRRLVVWSSRPANESIVDGLLGVAQEMLRWIPPAAYRDPKAAQAERKHVPLARLADEWGT